MSNWPNRKGKQCDYAPCTSGRLRYVVMIDESEHTFKYDSSPQGNVIEKVAEKSAKEETSSTLILPKIAAENKAKVEADVKQKQPASKVAAKPVEPRKPLSHEDLLMQKEWRQLLNRMALTADESDDGGEKTTSEETKVKEEDEGMEPLPSFSSPFFGVGSTFPNFHQAGLRKASSTGKNDDDDNNQHSLQPDAFFSKLCHRHKQVAISQACIAISHQKKEQFEQQQKLMQSKSSPHQVHSPKVVRPTTLPVMQQHFLAPKMFAPSIQHPTPPTPVHPFVRTFVKNFSTGIRLEPPSRLAYSPEEVQKANKEVGKDKEVVSGKDTEDLVAAELLLEETIMWRQDYAWEVGSNADNDDDFGLDDLKISSSKNESHI